MDTSEEHGGPKSVRTSCDSEPNSKRTKVSDDIEIAVSEEMGEAECDTLDTKTGEILDPGLVAAARSEEMRYMDDMGMFEDACDEECYAKTGKPPLGTRERFRNPWFVAAWSPATLSRRANLQGETCLPQCLISNQRKCCWASRRPILGWWEMGDSKGPSSCL